MPFLKKVWSSSKRSAEDFSLLIEKAVSRRPFQRRGKGKALSPRIWSAY